MTGPGAHNPANFSQWTLPETVQTTDVTVHATSICFDESAALFIGPSGSGKSSLALQMIGLGAQLISDDQTMLQLTAEGEIRLSPPDSIKGMIEARGIGLLRADHVKGCKLRLVVNLAEVETDRLPERRHVPVLGNLVRYTHKTESPAFAAALLQYLKAGEVHDR
jgi:HPr kinase/phosphorylase